jgi:hypothetical protein
MKLDLLADKPLLFGQAPTLDFDTGHSSTQRDGRGGKIKIGVQVGVGASLGINWAAVVDLARQAKESLSGGSQ